MPAPFALGKPNIKHSNGAAHIITRARYYICTRRASAPASDMANQHRCVCVLRAAACSITGKKYRRRERETRLGRAKGYGAPARERRISIPGIGTRTPRRRERGRNAFRRRTTEKRRIFAYTHTHTRAHTQRSDTKNNNNTIRKSYVPVYMQYPFSNKFRSSNTPRTLTDYLP